MFFVTKIFHNFSIEHLILVSIKYLNENYYTNKLKFFFQIIFFFFN